MSAIPKLYPILDTALLERLRMPLVETAQVMIDAGVKLMQWRCKKPLIGPADVETLLELGELCSRASVALIVNDRADLAAMAGARGVHVGQDDLTPDAVRRVVGSRAIVGLSTHNREQFVGASLHAVDYIALGPVFGTQTKENPDPEVGLALLARCAAATPVPVVAIGGITRDNAQSVWDAGAASVAVIGDLYPPHCDADSLHARLLAWLRLAEISSAAKQP